MRPIMTLDEVAQGMRSVGIPTSKKAISEGIQNGTYPFGRVRSQGPTGRCTFEISRMKFYQWLEAEFGVKEELQ